MSMLQNRPIQTYVHKEDVRNGKLVKGAKVFTKNKELPEDPLWTHLVVYEFLGPTARNQHVLGVVPLERGSHRTKVITKEAAVFENVRTVLLHLRPGHLDPGPPTDDDSTPLGNGNGCTPIIVAQRDDP